MMIGDLRLAGDSGMIDDNLSESQFKTPRALCAQTEISPAGDAKTEIPANKEIG